MPRRRNNIEQSLHAGAVRVQPLEKIPARSIHQQNVRCGALRKEILRFAVGRDSQFDQRVIKPDLIFHRNEFAHLVQVKRCGFRIKSIEAQALILQAVVEKTAVQNMFWAEIILQAE